MALAQMTGALIPSPTFDEIMAAVPIEFERQHVKAKGRPSIYSAEVAAKVVTLVAQGWTLEKIAKTEGLPSEGALWSWRMLRPDFARALERARTIQADKFAESAVELLDNVQIEDKEGNIDSKVALVRLREAEQRARIRLDLAKCYNPAQYGDSKRISGQIDINHSVTALIGTVETESATLIEGELVE